jgi:hypothetical protein
LEVILTLGVVAGLAATTRGDYSFENQTEVLKVRKAPLHLADNSISSFTAIHCIPLYG